MKNKPSHQARPTTIGQISAAIGMDVRELIMDGYSIGQINRVVDGKTTLGELQRSMPEDKAMKPKSNAKPITKSIQKPNPTGSIK